MAHLSSLSSLFVCVEEEDRSPKDPFAILGNLGTQRVEMTIKLSADEEVSAIEVTPTREEDTHTQEPQADGESEAGTLTQADGKGELGTHNQVPRANGESEAGALT